MADGASGPNGSSPIGGSVGYSGYDTGRTRSTGRASRRPGRRRMRRIGGHGHARDDARSGDTEL